MLKKVFVSSIAVWTLILAFATDQKPDTPPPASRPVPVDTIAATTTSSTTSTPDRGAHQQLQEHLVELDVLDTISEKTPCRELLGLAIDAGWPADKIILEQLGWILHKETRCQNITPTDSRWNGSDTGLLQVNQIHSDYVEQLYGEPYLEAMSNPWKNLNFGWILYSGREQSGRCGWQPWSISCE